ncbi:hypothetical protein HPP92_016469 [Vanilla planifolia]|uniref:Uncharacterized protein n=1 Tax=Vanilla planifolia TaxID=51239 RepID=A0A835QHL5_VANPL|nr:hypothetical protein HPP92_016469 [Vanilla planifolia]
MALVLYLQRAYRLHSVLQLFGGNDFDLVLATWFWMKVGLSAAIGILVMLVHLNSLRNLDPCLDIDNVVYVEAKPSELLFNYGFYMNLLQLFKELDLVKEIRTTRRLQQDITRKKSPHLLENLRPARGL